MIVVVEEMKKKKRGYNSRKRGRESGRRRGCVGEGRRSLLIAKTMKVGWWFVDGWLGRY